MTSLAFLTAAPAFLTATPAFLTAAPASLPAAEWFRGNLPLLYKMYTTIASKPEEFMTALTDHVLLLVVVPVLMAVAVAVPLGILATRFPKVERFILLIVNTIQTIPSLALLVLLLVAGLGLGKTTAITALFLYSLLPVLRNTIAGIKGVDPFLKEAALGMGMTSLQQLRLVELPLALSVIITGVRTATVICIGTGTLAAYVGGGGLGTYIVRGLAFFRNDLLLVGALPAAILALLADFLLGRLESRLIPRGLRTGMQAESSRRPKWRRTAAASRTASQTEVRTADLAEVRTADLAEVQTAGGAEASIEGHAAGRAPVQTARRLS